MIDDDLLPRLEALAASSRSEGSLKTWRAAAALEPDRTRACLDYALVHGAKPAAYLTALLRAGDWPQSKNGITPRHGDAHRTAAGVRRWIQSPGFDPEVDDDDVVLEEIERRERAADVRLEDELRAELLELARRRREAAR
jgi:hypothetical protein